MEGHMWHVWLTVWASLLEQKPKTSTISSPYLTFGSQRTIVKLLKSAMEEARSSQGFLVDGFPREMDQVRIFEEEVTAVHMCIRLIPCTYTLVRVNINQRCKFVCTFDWLM